MNPDHIVAGATAIFAILGVIVLYRHYTTPTYQDILLKLAQKSDPNTENEKNAEA